MLADSKHKPTDSPRKLRKYSPKKLIYVLAGVGFVTLIALAFRPTPIRVDVAQVKQGNIRVTVDGEGETRIRSRFVVSAPVAGRLARINLDEGDEVKKGALIAQIDPLPLNSQVREAQARLQQWQAERAGVETRRPKTEALLQAQARIRVAQAKKRETQAQVRRAQAALAQAKRDRIRAQNLQADGAVSRQDRESAELLETTRQRELEAAQREVESADASITEAQEALAILKAEQRDPDYLLDVYDAHIASVEAELEKLVDDASRAQIRSPINGYVLRVVQESAKYVEAGSSLLELGNPQNLEIVVDLLSTDAVKVKPGNKMLIEHWGGDKTLNAQVRYVEPSAFTKVSALGVEEQRVNIIADFVDYPVPLGDGYRVETKTVIWSTENALIVPLSALFRCDPNVSTISPSAWCTFVVQEGKASKREVDISQRSNFEAAITEGLIVGEEVILHPNEQIQEGKQVKGR